MTNILTLKLYLIVYRFDNKIVIKVMFKKILKFIILFILYINSKSLYNYLI